ncbi:MAG: TolC family protein [Proteobacteria bacterium]|nr:TolC family protein [Pseudomonadota bacterium]
MKHRLICLAAVALLSAAGTLSMGAASAAPIPAASSTLDSTAQSTVERLPGAPETLQSLLARTMEQDPQLLVARALEAASGERRAQARSRLAPVLNAQALQGQSKETLFGEPVDGRTSESSVGLRWNLYNGGADLAELRGSAHEVGAAREDVRRAQEEIGERIANAYAELLRNEELLPASRQRLSEAQRLVALVTRSTELGKLAPSDANQAQAALLDAQVAHGQLLADLRSGRDRLASLTGVTLHPLVPMELSDAFLNPDAPAGESGLLAAARMRAQATDARVLPWASTIAPRIDLDYNQQLHNSSRPITDAKQDHGWLVSARWDLPLGGENQARRAENVARAEAAKAEADRVERTLQSELATLPPRMANSRSAIDQLDEQVGQYDQLVRAGELQYQAGKRSLLQLVQLLESRYVAQQRRAEERYKLLAAQVRYLAPRGNFLPALGAAQN